MKNKLFLVGKLGVILFLFVLATACSGKKAETVAPKENAEIIVEQAELKNELAVPQQAEEIQPEQVVTALVEEEPAEKPVAPATVPPPAPQKPAAPKYAIGDKGPGGGLVFSVNNGTYKNNLSVSNSI